MLKSWPLYLPTPDLTSLLLSSLIRKMQIPKLSTSQVWLLGFSETINVELYQQGHTDKFIHGSFLAIVIIQNL